MFDTVTPLSVDSRRMSCDSTSGSRIVKADSGILRSPTVAVHPSMEGLVSFVPPELTERTLMHVSISCSVLLGLLLFKDFWHIMKLISVSVSFL